MKRNQSKIFFLMSYNSSSFDDMKFLTYGVPRRDIFQPIWWANFDALNNY